jgi:hypothetical protein
VGRIIISILITAVFASSVNAAEVTPYGENCISPYGMRDKPLNPHEAADAMQKYYGAKGLRVEIIEHRGRFIKADIYRGDIKVDTVVLDRKTGRIRSTY